MALSYADWYKAYAAKSGVALPAGYDDAAFTNPTYELNHQRLMGQLGGYAGTYNTARQGAAQEARTSAYDQGLSDETNVEQSGATVAGDPTLGTGDSMSYKITMGPDGRAYRQAYLNTGAQFGARRWGGSDEQGAQWKARQDLNAGRDRLTTGLGTKQGGLTADQGKAEGGTITDLSSNAGDYSSWKVKTAADAKAPAGGSDAPDPGTPDAPAAAVDKYRGIGIGGVLGTYGQAPNTDTLNKRWDKGSYKVVNKGTAKAPRYVVTRTK